MKDKAFLIWLRERLIHRYNESEYVDFVHKLTAIINDHPSDKITPNLGQKLKVSV